MSGRFLKYCRDEPALDNNGNIVNFVENNGTKNVEIMVPLNYLSYF